MTNGLIYDYRKGEFVEELHIGSLVSQMEKSFHVIFKDEFCFGATIYGCDPQSGDPFLFNAAIQVTGVNLLKHILRLKTQQLMFEVRKTEKKMLHGMRKMPGITLPFPTQYMLSDLDLDEFDDFDYSEPVIETFEPVIETSTSSSVSESAHADVILISLHDRNKGDKGDKGINSKNENQLRKQIGDFLQFMIDYNKKEYDDKDSFIKNLCDDMYIIMKYFGTEKQMLSCSSRETSQGRQQSYNVSKFDNNILTPHDNRDFNLVDDLNQLNDLNNIKYEVSQDIMHESYTSPACVKVMRAVSGKSHM
jgi:hypothetical protein